MVCLHPLNVQIHEEMKKDNIGVKKIAYESEYSLLARLQEILLHVTPQFQSGRFVGKNNCGVVEANYAAKVARMKV